MEFGLDARLTVYSGGLGILAGDHMKSASDLRLPVIGIGLLWDHGYVDQRLDDHGHPVDRYVSTDRDGLEHVVLPPGGVEVSIRGETVPLIAWRVRRYLTGELYLLEPARPEHRWVTARLYGGGSDDRLAQEIVLGVGGVRLLAALGKQPDVYHWNEGHAVFAGLELLRANRFGGGDLHDSPGPPAAPLRLHDPHAGRRRQRDPRPGVDATDGRRPGLHRRRAGGDRRRSVLDDRGRAADVADRQRGRRAPRRHRPGDVEERRRRCPDHPHHQRRPPADLARPADPRRAGAGQEPRRAGQPAVGRAPGHAGRTERPGRGPHRPPPRSRQAGHRLRPARRRLQARRSDPRRPRAPRGPARARPARVLGQGPSARRHRQGHGVAAGRGHPGATRGGSSSSRATT
jgi:hypothetical protein